MSAKNSISGSPTGNVVQAGVIKGGVRFEQAPNQEIGIVLHHERKEVDLAVDTEEWFHLTIVNRTRRARKLTFRVEGAPGLEWEILGDRTPAGAVEIAEDDVELELRVVCRTRRPRAGSAELRVLAGDAEVADNDRAWWFSNPKPIVVEPAPNLDAELEQPDRPVYAEGSYETVVTLENKGNTDLSGWLWTPTEFDGPEHPLWLTSEQVTFVDGHRYRLRPGDPAVSIPVEIKIPVSDWFERTWRVPLAVHVERDDMPPVERQFEIKQLGDLSRLIEWGRTPDTWKRRTIVALAAILLVAGITIGVLSAGSPSEADPSGVQAGMPTSSSPGPIADVRYKYAEMRCSPGDSVLVLHSLKKSTASADVQLLLDYETMWIRNRSPRAGALNGLEARLSTRDATCPKVIGAAGEEFTLFVWVGPFPSATAPEMCEALAKVVGDNCTPSPVA
jgi:hypothetical protein